MKTKCCKSKQYIGVSGKKLCAKCHAPTKLSKRNQALEELDAWAWLVEQDARRMAQHSDNLFKAAELARRAIREMRGKK